MVMMQDEKWMIRYKEVRNFIETNHRNPSKHDPAGSGDGSLIHSLPAETDG